LELAGKAAPKSSLEGKLSVYHAAAVALLYGKAGVVEFTDECVRRPEVLAMRSKVVATPDGDLDKASAHVRIVLKDGRTFERNVPHAMGSLEKPMRDADLESKFRELAAGTSGDAEKLIQLVWSIEDLDDATTLARATTQHHG
jgi:2-methylcitrate dehydratase PrpD